MVFGRKKKVKEEDTTPDLEIEPEQLTEEESSVKEEVTDTAEPEEAKPETEEDIEEQMRKLQERKKKLEEEKKKQEEVMQIISASIRSDGLYQYTVISNKLLNVGTEIRL